MRSSNRNSILYIVLALLTGLGLGLAYSWLLSPVTYVDATPAMLRADFKDQYRIVVAASYASSHDLARARARLQLLGDVDPVGQLSALAQNMVAGNASLEQVQPIAQLATDLQQGFSSSPVTDTPFVVVVNTPTEMDTPSAESLATETQIVLEEDTPIPTLEFDQTPLAPIVTSTFVPRPTFTPVPVSGDVFNLVGQDTVCDPGLQPGLLQFIIMDSRRRQVAGIEIIVSWSEKEDRFFTGFKPELGDGYADFVMQPDVIYSVHVVEGGAIVPNIAAPTCTDPNGISYFGGLLLTFQQP
ncbi:MAG TPA: hypothetical protein PLE39_04925 [Anaerolineales bacterium]|nr:hypothetical protein [Anaerolineales bacterium]HNE67700.1 hypothetical protein [Anaerolineales bacterium]